MFFEAVNYEHVLFDPHGIVQMNFARRSSTLFYAVPEVCNFVTRDLQPTKCSILASSFSLQAYFLQFKIRIMSSAVTNRRRLVYTKHDQKRWITFGAMAVVGAAGAALGYLYGKYWEKRSKGRTFNGQELPRNFRIVVFGDSTTWGYCPDSQRRLDAKHRYPSVLEKRLNADQPDKYRVELISEGLCGRTINEHDIEHNEKNQRRGLSMKGLDQILPALYSHKAIDIVVVMLGINDTKSHFNLSALQIANNMDKLLQKCIGAEIWPIAPQEMAHGPQIVVVAPAPVRALTVTNQQWGWNESSMRESQSLSVQYQKICEKYGTKMVHFVNAGDHIVTGSDSVHLDGENNIKLADALVPVIKEIIADLQRKQRE